MATAQITYDPESQIRDEFEYFAITLTATEAGSILLGIQTHWVGWVDDELGREIREPSIVRPSAMIKLWQGIRQRCVVVNDDKDLYGFLRAGGNALIEKGMAFELYPDSLAAGEARRETPVGWIALDALEPARLRRAPTKKVRMAVLKRDGRRCRVCGRRPDDHVDVDLHVHHIRPWGRPTFGLTEMANLITLCQTCHEGLEPHYDESLYEYVEDARLGNALDRHDREFREGVHRYRDFVKRALA